MSMQYDVLAVSSVSFEHEVLEASCIRGESKEFVDFQ